MSNLGGGFIFSLSWRPAPGVAVPGRHKRRDIWGFFKMTGQQSRDLARWGHWGFQKRQTQHLEHRNRSSWSWVQVFPAGTRQVVPAFLFWRGPYFRKKKTVPGPGWGPVLCVPVPVTVYLLSVPDSQCEKYLPGCTCLDNYGSASNRM